MIDPSDIQKVIDFVNQSFFPSFNPVAADRFQHHFPTKEDITSNGRNTLHWNYAGYT
jgi:hypothetical protein